MKNWRNLDYLPHHSGEGWLAYSNFRKKITTKQDIENSVKRWSPFDNLFIGEPGSKLLIPVLDTLEFREKAYGNFLRRSKICILIILITLIACYSLSFFRKSTSATQAFFITLSLTSFLLLDFFLITKNIEALKERTLFFIEIRRNSLKNFLPWLFFLIAIILIQYFLQEKIGGMEPLLVAYGTLYKAVSNGEYWRLFTGPLLHINLSHWASNAMMMVAAVAVASTISRKQATFIFMISCVAGATAGWAASLYSNHDCIVGISAGSLGLWGFCSGVALTKSRFFPTHFSVTTIHFGILIIYISWVMNPISSLEAHVVGWLSGVIYGVYYAKFHLKYSKK